MELGSGHIVTKHVDSATGGNMNGMPNGTLGLGTIETLNDLEVRQYLAR